MLISLIIQLYDHMIIIVKSYNFMVPGRSLKGSYTMPVMAYLRNHTKIDNKVDIDRCCNLDYQLQKTNTLFSQSSTRHFVQLQLYLAKVNVEPVFQPKASFLKKWSVTKLLYSKYSSQSCMRGRVRKKNILCGHISVEGISLVTEISLFASKSWKM